MTPRRGLVLDANMLIRALRARTLFAPTHARP